MRYPARFAILVVLGSLSCVGPAWKEPAQANPKELASLYYNQRNGEIRIKEIDGLRVDTQKEMYPLTPGYHGVVVSVTVSIGGKQYSGERRLSFQAQKGIDYYIRAFVSEVKKEWGTEIIELKSRKVVSIF